ncbi:MAG: 4-(cytidine 5'-diphospho)-2-C-methyl-D-erythritol kinase [Flexistipes sinusarabici]|uniref:4-diphosphocytidyl-2-C-methyl-D-erythritol kinase n=1 Tax=Flexistipes sinusarabici TaxID=2352 RepID=A0A5D0MK57_FLESI|nr:4-(cytidine 5'-diphospho)-2-C-methyl-D-erythritol kinase [Flexistipes sinusarabici]TYB34104.1 MAG: 4-(cytidine 5'-diphospho)-2-C-methyl-D-erythritol kinase [Flexistipes sinusarabici]
MLIRSYAKINLFLKIRNKRQDGFHNIETLMTPINLFDLLKVKKSKEFCITCNDKNIPVDENNIISKTFALIQKKYNPDRLVDVSLYKNIPSGAGLGGGSSNAAAFLQITDKLFGLNMGFDEKIEIMSEVGSDTVFFLYNQPAFVRGRGEIVDKTAVLPSFYILLVKPPVTVSTSGIYSDKNLTLTPYNPVSNMHPVLNYGDVLDSMDNGLQNVVFERHPETGMIKEKMLALNADAALLSGSGATVYGIYSSKKYLNKAYDYFKMFGRNNFVYKTENINNVI